MRVRNNDHCGGKVGKGVELTVRVDKAKDKGGKGSEKMNDNRKKDHERLFPCWVTGRGEEKEVLQHNGHGKK